MNTSPIQPLSFVPAVPLFGQGGYVFFSTLNRTAKSYAFAILGAEYVLKLLPRGTHNYAKFIRPSEMAAWSRNSGLEVREQTGLTYNPLTRHYRLVSHDVRSIT
ncbi:hypothetical protein HSBAA_32180 [Vreelandella sulfidaeris]|uniref:3-demethylubiquinone-9 3-O-methyltransferase n=1 Tax=Vreelandella sulfidaeris TaxID=115553 RepID=A0A455U712_9GAMM|nr:hypothetical protein HSBAA_32180 [Halomonas sulfidaeris]